MIIKRSLTFFFLLLSIVVTSQVKNFEIGLVSDNDLYTSSVYDRYYTNGLELYFKKAINPSNAEKRILSFKIGQYIYNPQTRNADNLLVNDRPFCGYLFGEVGLSRFYKSENVLKTDLQIGFIGQNAFGEEMQKGFHELFGFKTVRGWQNQIHNAFLAQIAMTHYLSFTAMNDHRFSIGWQNRVQLGTILNGITSGLNARIAIKKLLPVHESNLFDAAAGIQQNVVPEELYLFVNPNVSYQFYDATVQGSMFGNNSPVTFDLLPVRFILETGLKYRYNKWNLHYTFNYRSKEVDNNANVGYFYGSIKLGYLF